MSADKVGADEAKLTEERSHKMGILNGKTSKVENAKDRAKTLNKTIFQNREQETDQSKVETMNKWNKVLTDKYIALEEAEKEYKAGVIRLCNASRQLDEELQGDLNSVTLPDMETLRLSLSFAIQHLNSYCEVVEILVGEQ